MVAKRVLNTRTPHHQDGDEVGRLPSRQAVPRPSVDKAGYGSALAIAKYGIYPHACEAGRDIE